MANDGVPINKMRNFLSIFPFCLCYQAAMIQDVRKIDIAGTRVVMRVDLNLSRDDKGKSLREIVCGD